MIKHLEIEKFSNHTYSIVSENKETFLKEIRKYKTNMCDHDTYKCYIYDENLNLIELFTFKQDLNLTYNNENFFQHSNFVKHSPKYNDSNCLKIRYIPCTNFDVKVVDINKNIKEILKELRKHKTDKYCTAREECYVYDSNSNLIEFFILKRDNSVLDSESDVDLPPLPENINIII